MSSEICVFAILILLIYVNKLGYDELFMIVNLEKDEKKHDSTIFFRSAK